MELGVRGWGRVESRKIGVGWGKGWVWTVEGCRPPFRRKRGRMGTRLTPRPMRFSDCRALLQLPLRTERRVSIG